MKTTLLFLIALALAACGTSRDSDCGKHHGKFGAGQIQGDTSSAEGRLGGEIGTPTVAADYALGAGWGTTASVSSVVTGSNDQRGRIAVTSAGTGQAQATATVTLTFHDGAWAAKPWCLVKLVGDTNGAAEAPPTSQTETTTTFAWTHAVLPVAAAVYTFEYVCVQ